ncbi:unnamed protein product [Hymenolepis diminuta]|uniref:Uncharacterized protein n=1 Tax=Hymenolepis diminuta TaxID=6216 RepID=A0A564Z5R0_HYMDI|nr:unnamed protein product [Hymenolepis diminuta]
MKFNASIGITQDIMKDRLAWLCSQHQLSKLLKQSNCAITGNSESFHKEEIQV